MSPIIQTMKNQQPTRKRGGARPKSRPKVNIAKNLILHDIALSLDVGLDRARRILAEWNNQPEWIIGKNESSTADSAIGPLCPIA